MMALKRNANLFTLIMPFSIRIGRIRFAFLACSHKVCTFASFKKEIRCK